MGQCTDRESHKTVGKSMHIGPKCDTPRLERVAKATEGTNPCHSKETLMTAFLRFSILLVLGAVACQKTNPGSTEPANQTRAKIENRASVDMDISVRRNDGRSSPLGFAPGGETTVFRLPAGITAGAAWVRFVAKPVRSSGETVESEPFPIQSGDEITWSVPPQ